MKSFVAYLTALLLRIYLRTIGRTITARFTSPSVAPIDIDSYFLSRTHQRAIYVLWIVDHVNLLALAYVSPTHRALASRFSLLTADSVGGRVMQYVLKAIGGRALVIARHDPARRLHDLRSVKNTDGPLFIAIDGGGPYFRVSPAAGSLAIALSADVIPCSVTSDPSITLRLVGAPISIPLPFSHLTASV